MSVLVTGAAGFIGYHLSRRLLHDGVEVIGVDNLNDYYDISLKQARLDDLAPHENFNFAQLDVANSAALERLFDEERPDVVVHLAAQAGVRHSLTHPHAYASANLVGFLNVLEACRQVRPAHLVYASSSSVYGGNTRVPFSVHDNVDHPLSLYAATKKSNELMAHSYSHLYGLPTTGLRFFTVYGPYGRPDMAYFAFTRRILAGQPIEVYNEGRMERDFTYVDDVVEGLVRILGHVPGGDPAWRSDAPDAASSHAPYRLYNIGNHRPVGLLHFIEVLETCLGRTAVKRLLPMQPGDLPVTCADIDDLARDVGFVPHTPIEEGLAKFVAWYRDYYGS